MMRSRHMSYAQSEDASSIRIALGASLRRRRQEAERSLTELAIQMQHDRALFAR